MSRIQQLNPHVVNRIAAGEVIERPASVVKELLENSVDAGATRIEIDVADGGMQQIRISDNGEGIHPDDLLLAVTSHATSKIRSDTDLRHVATLGFRGEALASIASVSRFHVRTRTAEHATGSELECHGGEITLRRECGCPPGTVMDVRHLFFNTPARRKFLRKPSTEFGHIVEQFTRVALASPNLHLVLRHNDNLVHELPATTSTLDRIRRFAGGELADRLIPVDSRSDLATGQSIRLWGYVAEPTVSKSTRRSQYLFLNGRCIQDRSLQHALSEAYRGLLMVGRHPVSYLFLEVPPSLVDVNVHPTKTEVRFLDGQSLYRQLLRTLRDKFRDMDFRPRLDVANTPGRQSLDLQSKAPPFRQGALDVRDPLQSGPTLPESAPDVPGSLGSASRRAESDPPGRHRGDDLPEPQPMPAAESLRAASAGRSGEYSVPSASTATDSAASPASAAVPAASGSAAESTPVAAGETEIRRVDGPAVTADEFRAFQIHDCYLVVATDEGLEVIDQHALHERILYERLRQRILSGQVERQKLLLPQPVELSATEAAALVEHSDLLHDIGFEIQEFGGTTVLLAACPVLIPRGSLDAIIREFAERLEQTEGRTTRRDLLDNMLHTMACRAAIKAGQRLAPEEMRELLRQRHLVDDAHHCPHGRPTALTLTRGALDQQFGRLG